MAEVLAALIGNTPKIEKSGAESGNVLVMLFTVTQPFESEIRIGIPEKDAQEATRVIMGMEVQPSKEVVLDACQEIAGQTAGAVNIKPEYKTYKIESKLDSEYKGAAPADALWKSINSIEEGKTTTKVHVAAWASVPGIPAAAHAGNKEQIIVDEVTQYYTHNNIDQLRRNLTEHGIVPKFARSDKLETSVADYSGTSYWFKEDEAATQWLLVDAGNGSDTWVAPLKSSIFGFSSTSDVFRFMFDGFDYVPQRPKFEKLHQSARMQAVASESGRYTLVAKGNISLVGVTCTLPKSGAVAPPAAESIPPGTPLPPSHPHDLTPQTPRGAATPPSGTPTSPPRATTATGTPLYFEMPTLKGEIKLDNLKPVNSRMMLYKLITIFPGADTAEVFITDPAENPHAHTRSTGNHREYLFPLCSYYDPPYRGYLVIMDAPGTMQLTGGRWAVIKKIKVHFEPPVNLTPPPPAKITRTVNEAEEIAARAADYRALNGESAVPGSDDKQAARLAAYSDSTIHFSMGSAIQGTPAQLAAEREWKRRHPD